MSLLADAATAATAAAATAAVETLTHDDRPGRRDDDRRDGDDRRPPSRLPGRFETHSTSGAVTEAGVQLRLAGFASGDFGATQVLLSTAADPRRQLLRVAFERGGQREAIPEVSVHALQRLFSRPLLGPVVVVQNERLVVPVRATDAAGEGRLRLALRGHTGEQLAALARSGRLHTEGAAPTRRPVEPILLGAHEVVPAGATTHAITFEGRGVDLDVVRVAASTDTEAHDHALGLTLRGRRGNDFADLSPAQLHQLFERDAMRPPVQLPNEFRFSFYVDNPTAEDVPLSVVVEAYPAGSLDVESPSRP